MSILEMPEILIPELPAALAVELADESEETPPALMTLEEVLLLPEDRKRDLIDGQLVEYPMTLRNRWACWGGNPPWSLP